MERKINIEATKNEAEKILAEMNDLVRERDFAKIVMDDGFEELRCKIMGLGWLPLCASLKMKEVDGKREMRVQLKLVDPESEEAKAYDFGEAGS